MKNSSFTILGTSSGVPQADRVCSGYVLDCGGQLTLFDCGGGVTSAFLRAGFDFRLVDRIIISHTHSDHVCELSLFLQGMYLARRDRPVKLYLPSEFLALFRSYLTAVYLFPERFSFPLEMIGYAGSLEIDDSARITAFANSHLQKYRPYVDCAGGQNKMQSHSFMIKTGAAQLLYSADIGSFDDLAPHLDGMDYVVTELSHVDRQEFFNRIGGYKVGRFIITHIDGAAEKEEIERLAREAGVANLEIATHGLQLEL